VSVPHEPEDPLGAPQHVDRVPARRRGFAYRVISWVVASLMVLAFWLAIRSQTWEALFPDYRRARARRMQEIPPPPPTLAEPGLAPAPRGPKVAPVPSRAEPSIAPSMAAARPAEGSGPASCGGMSWMSRDDPSLGTRWATRRKARRAGLFSETTERLNRRVAAGGLPPRGDTRSPSLVAPRLCSRRMPRANGRVSRAARRDPPGQRLEVAPDVMDGARSHRDGTPSAAHATSASGPRCDSHTRSARTPPFGCGSRRAVRDHGGTRAQEFRGRAPGSAGFRTGVLPRRRTWAAAAI
jgi:hypothetical protein